MSLQLLGKTLKPTKYTYMLPKDGNILKAYNSQDLYKKPIKAFKNYNIYSYSYNNNSKQFYMDCSKVTSKSSKYIFLFKSKNKLWLMWFKKIGKKIFSINDSIVQLINIHYAEQCLYTKHKHIININNISYKEITNKCLNDIYIHNKLGEGFFGAVYLVCNNKHKKYILKIQKIIDDYEEVDCSYENEVKINIKVNEMQNKEKVKISPTMIKYWKCKGFGFILFEYNSKLKDITTMMNNKMLNKLKTHINMLHKHNIYHTDIELPVKDDDKISIEPGKNILTDSKGSVYIIDYGCAIIGKNSDRNDMDILDDINRDIKGLPRHDGKTTRYGKTIYTYPSE